jgi:GH25 family lysozyme M1 (1,4-beta-N-acetylmuramidase)
MTMPSDYMLKRKKLRTAGIAGAVATIATNTGIYFTQPEPGRTLGIDVSHWTHIVDWDKAKAAGIKFAIIKYMDGILPTDYAEINYAGAVGAGLLVGSYQWLRSEISEGRQAKEYAAMLKNMPVDLPPAVDYEPSFRGKKYDPDIGNLYSMIVPLLSLVQRQLMLYTSPGFWGNHGSLNKLYADCALWEAHYTWKQAPPSPILPWPRGYSIWQFTETGEGARFGVDRYGERAVDLNYFPGTVQELYAWSNKELPT